MLDYDLENNQNDTETSQNPENMGNGRNPESTEGGQNPENIYQAKEQNCAPQESVGAADEVGSSTVNWTTATPIVAQTRSGERQSDDTGELQGVYSGSVRNDSDAGTQGSYSNTVQNAREAGSQSSYSSPVQNVDGTGMQSSYSSPVRSADDAGMQNSYSSSVGNADDAGMQGSYSSPVQNTSTAELQGTFSGSTPVTPLPEEPKQNSKGKKAKKVKKAREKKPMGIVKRAFAAALCGILFGGAAAGSFYGIYQLVGGPEIIESMKEASAGSTTSTVVISNTDLVNSAETDSDTETTSISSTWITEVADAVMPSMVSVTNNYTESSTYFGYSYSQSAVSVGSGIIIGSNDTELLIATNQHVIDSYDSLSVTFVDGSEVTAYLKGSDVDMDLAVLAVLYEDVDAATLEEIRIAVLGDSDELVLGQEVVAIGNALGYGQSVTNGIVSALNREIETESGGSSFFIQTNAAVNPGNSGGALLDSSGRVIGIVSAKIGGDTVEGMGFAIPINSAVDIINDLSTNTTMIKFSDEEKGYLGVSVLSDSYNTQSQREMYGIPEGAYVRSVEEGEAAYNAGIQAGDVITAIDSNTVTGYDDLSSVLQYYSAGTEVTVTFLRNTSGVWVEMEVTATLGSYPVSEG
ncbi:MAG: trypsin-like peptidase domain-containing protein [Lachnospiraceae bacterium]|nr:trypsin-like peptidase domain-containing protein [Lachnospiraceae bacterium]